MHRKINSCLFALSLLIASGLSNVAHAEFFYSHLEPKASEYSPWFTGPLLAPSGHVVPLGHYNIEPYVFTNVVTGSYTDHWHAESAPNFYRVFLQLPIQIGLAQKLDVQFVPQVFYNQTDNVHSTNIGDLPVLFDVQLFLDTPDHWWPAGKFSFGASAPTGKYQKLNPRKEGTDATGAGSLLPTVGLTFSKLYHFTGVHFINLRLAFGYTVGSPVHVKGVNTYGGGHGTHGKVFPGNVFNADAAVEYSLTQNWAVAMDAVYTHGNKTRFYGNPGTDSGEPADVGGPSFEQFSLAPALEYDFTPNLGIIGGIWFTVAGRNANRFTNGVIALNIYI